MTADKLKQYIGLFGGVLGAVLLFLQSIGLTFTHFNDDTINAFVNVLESLIPFILVAYGVYKNSYIITEKAKEQENELKKKGMK